MSQTVTFGFRAPDGVPSDCTGGPRTTTSASDLRDQISGKKGAKKKKKNAWETGKFAWEVCYAQHIESLRPLL